MITKTNTINLQKLLKEFEATIKFKTCKLVFNAQGNEFFIYDDILRGIAFVNENILEFVWIEYPLTISEIITNKEIFEKIPSNVTMNLNPVNNENDWLIDIFDE